MVKKPQKGEDSFFIASDLSDRLLPNLPMSELLLWPPDLFAYTSYVLSFTGAYQLVISPPKGEKWPPQNEHLKKWLAIDNAKNKVGEWFEQLSKSKDWSLTSNCKSSFLEFMKDMNLDFDVEVEELENDQSQIKKYPLQQLLNKSSATLTDRRYWKEIVVAAGNEWREKLKDLTITDFNHIDDIKKSDKENRCPQIFRILLERTPAIVLACWSHFYKKTIIDENTLIKNPNIESDRKKMPIEALSCSNADNRYKYKVSDLWITAQALITMHAICDEACVNWGIKETTGDGKNHKAARIAKNMLLHHRGTLSTINPDRCRVLPKRHNPSLGITLRSLSSNLAFHRSSVEVVWRSSAENKLTKKLMLTAPNGKSTEQQPESDSTKEKNQYISMLLLPLPIHTMTKDFRKEPAVDRVEMNDKEFGFFSYKPEEKVTPQQVTDLISNATSKDLAYDQNDENAIDIVVLPECAMREDDVTTKRSDKQNLEERLLTLGKHTPSIYVVGVREDLTEKNNGTNMLTRFARNAVYCKYFDPGSTNGNKFGDIEEFRKKKNRDQAPKYVQYKHHRWQLNATQIKQYGLSQQLDTGKKWWEAIKIPRRRVSFLNVGDKMTLCHLICEDLARQDPIADLIRQVGPSLVVTILLDGPQQRDRWASRYATVLSEDPGCSVIALTSFGMVSRWNSPYRSMSRVIALWSNKESISREIELEHGAEAVLLTIEVGTEQEITADGRKESKNHTTSVFKLVDVIQVYPESKVKTTHP